MLKALEVPAFDYDDLVIAGEKGKKAASAAKGTKRKRDFVPDGAEIGFRKASDIVGAGAPKEPTLEERKTAAILDEDELAYLDSHWRRKPPEDSLIAGIRDDAPLGLPLASRIDPSSHHARLRQAVQIASTMSDKAMRADWESKAVFRRQLVHDWPTDRRGTAVERNHLSCRLPPPASPYKSAPPVKAMAKVEIAPIVGKEEDSKPMVNEDGELLFIIKDDAIDSDEDGDLPDPALLFSGGPAGRSAIARSKPQAPSVVPSSLTHTAGSRRSTPLVIEIDSDNEVDPLMLFKDDEGETDTAVGTTPEGDEDDGVATGAASPELGETPREPQLFRASSPELGADNNKKEAPAAEELHELDEDGDAPMREPSPELLFAVHGMTSSDDHFTSPVVSPVPHVPSPPPTHTLKKDSSHDEFDDLDLDDDDALAELDAAQPRSIADIDLMPPPPVSAASRRGPREVSANLLMTQQRPRSIPRKKSLTAIEASPSFARLQKTASIVIDDSSSPQIVVPGRRANQPRIVQTSEEEDEERPRAPPRRIVGPRLVRKRDEVEEEEEAPRKRKKKRRDGPRGVALHRYDIFDVEAVDDDADGNESSEAEVEVRASSGLHREFGQS